MLAEGAGATSSTSSTSTSTSTCLAFVSIVFSCFFVIPVFLPFVFLCFLNFHKTFARLPLINYFRGAKTLAAVRLSCCPCVRGVPESRSLLLKAVRRRDIPLGKDFDTDSTNCILSWTQDITILVRRSPLFVIPVCALCS